MQRVQRTGTKISIPLLYTTQGFFQERFCLWVYIFVLNKLYKYREAINAMRVHTVYTCFSKDLRTLHCFLVTKPIFQKYLVENPLHFFRSNQYGINHRFKTVRLRTAL